MATDKIISERHGDITGNGLKIVSEWHWAIAGNALDLESGGQICGWLINARPQDNLKILLGIKILIWWIIEIKEIVDHVRDVIRKGVGIFRLMSHVRYGSFRIKIRVKIRIKFWNYKPSCNLNWYAIVHSTLLHFFVIVFCNHKNGYPLKLKTKDWRLNYLFK